MLLRALAVSSILLALCAIITAFAVLWDNRTRTREQHTDVWLVSIPRDRFVGHCSLECIPRVGENVFWGAFVGVVVEVAWLFGLDGSRLSVYVRLEELSSEAIWKLGRKSAQAAGARDE